MNLKCRLLALWLSLLSSFTLAEPTINTITAENYDDVTKDRSVLVRFVINHEMCEECEATAEAWEQLSKEWQEKSEDSIGLLAEIFCDKEEQADICEWFEVAGYPSLYWGDPESPELYKGGLDYESLSEFAKENLSTLPCSVKNLEVCGPRVKKVIAKLQTKTQEELYALEKDVLKKVEDEQTRFDKTALKLQQQYKDLANNFNTKIGKIREDSGFKWIQQLLNEIEKANERELEEEDEEDESEGKTDEL